MRVIQWATGAMGKNCLRAVLAHPDHELVGLFVYGERKAGQDAGTIANMEPCGVIATRNADEIIALDADVVIHAARLDPPFERHDPDILRLLRSGKSVISINGGTFPPLWSPERRAAFEAACAEGQSRFMGAGLNPGFAAEKLGVVASGLCTDMQTLSVRETVDCRAVKSATYVFDVIGFGADPASTDPNAPDWLPALTMNAMFREVVGAVGDRLHLQLDEIITAHALQPAHTDIDIAAGRIAKGTTAQIDWRWLGKTGDDIRVDLGISWTMQPDDSEAGHKPLWTIDIVGTPTVRLKVDLETPAGWTFRTTAEQLGVAGAVINTIPVLMAMPPGLHATPIATPFRAPGT